MATVDFRTRLEGGVDLLDPTEFSLKIGSPLSFRPVVGRPASPRSWSDLVPLTLEVEGDQLTLVPDDHGLEARPGRRRRTGRRPRPPGLLRPGPGRGLDVRPQMTGRARGAPRHCRRVHRVGACSSLPARRTPGYEPGRSLSATATVRRSTCTARSPRRRARGDRPLPGRGRLSAPSGRVHRGRDGGRFGANSTTQLPSAEPDDGASWWARTEAVSGIPSRILGFNQKSPTLRALLHSDRFRSDRDVYGRPLRPARSRYRRLGRRAAEEGRCRRRHLRRELA